MKFNNKQNRTKSFWNDFIYMFDLEPSRNYYGGLDAYYCYESGVEDPSPGYRIMLLFDNKKLAGILHSRELDLLNMTTTKLDWSYSVSFYNDYPHKKQKAFVDYMNLFIRSVD
jgi:hypothetical protein